jgi:hypothetical protein
MVKKNRILSVLDISICGLALILPSCGNGGPKLPDVSGSEVTIEAVRYEDDIFGVTDSASYRNLLRMDSSFFDMYLYDVMGDVTRQGFVPFEVEFADYKRFITNSDMQHLYNSVIKTYPDVNFLNKELSSAFTYYHYYFPNKTIPKVVTFAAPFRYSIIPADRILGIGLDMYLGADFEPYQSPQLEFPIYRINKFRREYITSDAMKAWMLTNFPAIADKKNLLSHIVYEGKILYSLDRLLPKMQDSLKIGYKSGGIEWCNAEEKNIWNHLISSDLLYATEFKSFAGLITDGPFSKGENIPPEAPPLIATWIGWQIIRSYMSKNPDVTLLELFEQKTSDDILQNSGYKP